MLPTVVIQGLNITAIAASCVVLVGVASIVEVLNRLDLVHGEYSRKAVHISLGVILEWLPLYLSQQEIIVVCVIGFTLAVVDRYVRIYRSGFEVKRWTIGELIYPVGVAAAALLFDDPAVYTIAVLHIALCDGFASVVGTALQGKQYHIFGGQKSYIGSATFCVISFALLAGFLLAVGTLTTTTLLFAFASAIVLSVVEGVFSGGFDNLAVPIVAGYMVQFLS